MPIPFIIAGVAVATGIIGAGAHMSAKETNEKAQRRYEEAKELYDSTKEKLDESKAKAEKSINTIRNDISMVLTTSMAQFLDAYSKVKKVNFQSSSEISELKFDKQDMLEIKKLTNIYQSQLKTGIAGAVVGGGVVAGGALAAGAVFTPLAVVAAPIVLFTGISASIKADENLEKANAEFKKAEAAAEQMKISITKCKAVKKAANMYDELLNELNVMFAQCSAQFAAIVDKKTGIFKTSINEDELTQNEIELMAVTRSLAGAIKSIIDISAIQLKAKEERTADENKKLSNYKGIDTPLLQAQANQALAIDYGVKPVPVSKTNSIIYSGASTTSYARNMIAFAAGLMLAIFFTKDIVLSITNSSDMFLFISATNANTIAVFLGLLSIGSMFFGNFIFGSKMHKFLTFSFSISAVILYVQFCRSMESIEHYIKIPGAIMLFACALLGILSSKEKRWCSATFFSNCFLLLFLCVLFFYIYLFFAIYLGWFSHNFWLVATTCAFGLFVLGATQIDAYEKNN